MSYRATMTMGATSAKGSAIASAVTAAANVATDPALPQVIALVNRLSAIEAARAPKGVAVPTRGIGLGQAVLPLKALVFMAERPWVKPVAAAAVIGAPFILGFLFGRKARRP